MSGDGDVGPPSGAKPGNGLAVTAPGGWGLQITGRDVILFVCLCVVGASIVVSNYRMADSTLALVAEIRRAEDIQVTKLDSIILNQTEIRKEHQAKAVQDANLACLEATPVVARAKAALAPSPCDYLAKLIHGTTAPAP